MKAHHSPSDVFTAILPSSVFLFYWLVFLVLLVISGLTRWCNIKFLYTVPQKVQAMMPLKQVLLSYFSALKISDRESLIREEVTDATRLGTSKLSKENLKELVTREKADPKFRLTGYPSYRVLRSKLAEQFNYFNPGLDGFR